jgi:tetratricopeptide (TPR) repeat protein
MLSWIALLALGLVLPATADEKKKQEKPKAGAPAAPSPAELMSQADARIAAGDLDGAADLLRKATALPGADGQPAIRLGRLLDGRGDLDGAIDAYQQAAEKLSGGDKGEALGRLAVAQELRGLSASAATAQAAAAADPEGLWPTLALARQSARGGKADEALALAQKAAGKGGGAAASVALGAAHEAKGDLAAAEADYRSASTDAGQRLPATLGLARVLRKTGRAAEAAPLLAKLIEQAPGAVGAYAESARVKMALGRTEEAMGDAATAAALAEDDPEAKQLSQEISVAKALTWLPKNQPDFAVQELTRLRDANPDVAAVRVGLGKAYVAKRQAEPAMAELKKALELDPASAEAQYQLGVVSHTLVKDPAAAVAAYEKAAAADPANAEYRRGLGFGLIDLGGSHVAAKRYKEAVTVLDKAIALVPDNPSAEAYLAWAYFGLKDSKNFVAHAQKAKALGHSEPNLISYLDRVAKGEAIK